jgi:hypothetical protein
MNSCWLVSSIRFLLSISYTHQYLHQWIGSVSDFLTMVTPSVSQSAAFQVAFGVGIAC